VFYPGDPIEQKKRALIARLAARNSGRGSSLGVPLGHPQASYGRGVGFHPGGVGLPGHGEPQGFPGQGNGPPQGFPPAGGNGQDPNAPGNAQAQAPAQAQGGYMPPAAPQYQGSPYQLDPGPTSLNPALLQLLQQYGQMPQMPQGGPNRFF